MTEREVDGQTNMERERVEAKIAGFRNMFNHLESVGFSQHSRFRLDQDITDPEQAAQFLRNYHRVGLLKERLLDRAIPRLESDLERIGQAESEQRQLPQMEINPETRMVRIGDRIISFGGTRLERQWRLLMRLAQNAGEIVPTKELEPTFRESGARGQNSAGQSVADLREKLEEDPKHPKLLISAWHGKDSGHSLQVSVKKEEERLGPFDVKLSDGLVVKTQGTWEAQALRKLDEMGDRRLPLAELSVLVFPDDEGDRALSRTIGIIRKLNTLLPVGVRKIVWDRADVWLQNKEQEGIEKGREGLQTEEVPTIHRMVFLEENQVELDGRKIKLSPKEFSILQTMARHVNTEMVSRNLSQEALNNSNPRSASLNPTILDIKRKINQPDIFDSKVGSASSWFKLQNVDVVWPGELQPEAEGTPPTFSEEELAKEVFTGMGEIVSVPTEIQEVSLEGIEIIPYIPSEEEKRSKEEDALLGYILKTFLENHRITFEDMQAALKSPKSIRRMAGQVQVYIYQAPEIKEMLHSSIRKLREEAGIDSLRADWNDNDNNLWEMLQLAARRHSGGDFQDFQRRVSNMIDVAQRNFYRSLSEEQRSSRIHWVNLPREHQI